MKPMSKIPDKRYEPHWRRLKFVIEQSGLSEERFAEFVGLEEPELIDHIRYAQCGIDAELAECIHQAFPQFGIDWLLGKPSSLPPETAEMFPQVRQAEEASMETFNRAEEEYLQIADTISKILIHMIPAAELSRKALGEQYYRQADRFTELLETMQRNTLPATRQRMQEANRTYDDLCCAADVLGFPL